MSRSLCRSTLAVALLWAIASQARAVDAAPPPVTPPDAEQNRSGKTQPPRQPSITDLDRVRVTATGTRIPRAGFDTLEPAQVIGRELLEDTNTVNLIDLVARSPSFGAGASYYGNQSSFGAGVNFAQRFGLGSNRLLTLVNGRRFVTSNPPTVFGPDGGGTQVDLSNIPTNMVQRIENISIGGAPTYGSDAISGVSNIILRDNFSGMETQAGYGQTERGDVPVYLLSNLLGSDFADGRGHFVLSTEVSRTEGVRADTSHVRRHAYSLQLNPDAKAIAQYQPGRDPATDGRVNGQIPFNSGPSDGVPASVYIRDTRWSDMTFGGLALPTGGSHIRDASGQLRGFGPNQNQLLQFDTQGQLVPYNPGNNFGRSFASGGDGINPVLVSQLVSDQDRANVFSTGHFDFTDSLRGFWEASWGRVRTRELVNQNAYNAVGFGYARLDGGGSTSGALEFPADHPLLTAQARQTLQDMGVQSFRLSRSSRDLGMSTAASESQLWRVVGGLSGPFDLAGRSYNWEATMTHGQGRFDYLSRGLIQQNFINALNATRDAAGNVVCDSTRPGTTADPACAPLDLFGQGRASREALAYVSTPTRATSDTAQTVFNTNVTGGLFDLPGGETTFNVGYEYRREAASFTPSTYQRLGLGRAVPIQGSRGSYYSNEYFGEVFAPLVDSEAGIPGLHRLDLTGKLRRVQSSVNGGFNAYTYGFQYEPLEGLQLRANRTQSFRAPSISELYTSSQAAYFFIPEPCEASSIDSGPRPDLRRANCQKFFAAYPGINPNTFESAGTSQLGYTSGSTSLRNEKARSWTAGLVLKPKNVEGLRAAVDYYNINLTDVITELGESDITSGCFDSEVFDASDVNNANRFCSMITRDPATAVATSIRTTYANGPYINFKGWTAEVNYLVDLAQRGWGRGSLQLNFYGYFPRTW